MNKRQKLVQERFLDNEEAVIKKLETSYETALADITKKSQSLYDDINRIDALAKLTTDDDEKAKLLSQKQAKVYQKQYQDALKKQVSGILDTMHAEEFKTVSDYLQLCYEDAFVGTMFDMQGQGIPLCFPLDQESMVRAVQLDSKISEGLYNAIGENVAELKKSITAEVARGIATGATFSDIARNLRTRMTGDGYDRAGGMLYRSKLIARTEGHRIQCQATMDACHKAKEKGADVVKQWDATLDAKTRDSHAQVDGEIRELDKPFSNGLMFPGDPGGGAAEVCNCRCALLQRARWALDGSFTKMNNITGQIEEFESPEDYAEFKKAFFSKENRQYMNYVQQMEDKYGTKNFIQVIDGMSEREYNHYSELLASNPVFRKKSVDDGVFTTFNSTKADTIRPKSIMSEMRKSKTGTDALEYLEKENVPVRLYYGVDNPDGKCGLYDPLDDEIVIFCDKTKTTKETALTVIHEATHRKLGGNNSFEQEVECFKAEYMHKKGHLTDSDIDDIIAHVKENYPELI